MAMVKHANLAARFVLELPATEASELADEASDAADEADESWQAPNETEFAE